MFIRKPEVHKKLWGEEHWIANNELYCGKILKLNEGYKCSYHCHEIKDETFYILKGKVFMIVEKDQFILNVGDTIRLKPGIYHSFTGIVDSEILEISTQHFEDDSYRKDKSGPI